MPNGSNNSKVWYKSKTIWLLIAQLMGVWSLNITGEASIVASMAITMTTVAGFITRYYTNEGVTLKNKDAIS